MTFILYLVAKDCKAQGLPNIGKDQIFSAVKKVRDFFGIAASVDGKKVETVRKSNNQMGKASGKRDLQGLRSRSNLSSCFIQYEETRHNAHSLIVGLAIEDQNLDKNLKGIDTPFLIISVEDLNSKNFANQLGRTMLEPSCTIFIKTASLERCGL